MNSKTISRLPGVASEGHRTALMLLVVPNPVPKPEGPNFELDFGLSFLHLSVSWNNPASVGRSPRLKTRIDRFALQGENAEDAFVHAA
jgi:hypothetical protein